MVQSPLAVSTSLIDTSAGEPSDGLSLTDFEYFLPSLHESITDAERSWLCEAARHTYSGLKQASNGSKVCSKLKDFLNWYMPITWPVMVIRDDLDVKQFNDIKLFVCQIHIISSIPTYLNWRKNFYNLCSYQISLDADSSSHTLGSKTFTWMSIGISIGFCHRACCCQIHRLKPDMRKRFIRSAWMREYPGMVCKSSLNDDFLPTDLWNYWSYS